MVHASLFLRWGLVLQEFQVFLGQESLGQAQVLGEVAAVRVRRPGQVNPGFFSVVVDFQVQGDVAQGVFLEFFPPGSHVFPQDVVDLVPQQPHQLGIGEGVHEAGVVVQFSPLIHGHGG